MSLAESFDQLTVGDIAEFIRVGKEEHLQLDFKTINNPNFTARDDRKNLAKCISGFANSAGGVVIWGVDARENAQGIDCAVATAEINQLRLFIARLNEFSGQSASPVVDGIRHKAIETAGDRGYAVTLVPESGSGPHMAKLGEDRYYKRPGHQFYRMEHFDLEDMFGRRQRPDLSITINNRREPNNPDHEQLEVMILNVGRAVARHVGFFAEMQGATIVRARQILNVSHLNDGRQVFNYTNNTDVFHPNRVANRIGTVVFQRTNVDEDVSITFTYYCERMKPKKDSISLRPEPPAVPPNPIEPH